MFNSHKKVFLNGIGGIGKSAIAKEFLNANVNYFDYKAWINYKENITSSIISDLNIHFKFQGDEKEVFNQIIYELNNLKGNNNLMIIDNFDNPSSEDKAKVKEFLPNFKILITSRDKIDSINTISIEKLNDDEAIRLFEKHCEKAYDKEQLKTLLNHIDNHSLLIELIAKAIQKSNLNSLDLIYKKFQDKNLQEIKTKIELKDKSDLIIAHIKALFNLNSLTENQILILKKFAVLPSVEISFDDLIKMFDIQKDNLSEFENDLNELVSKGWINQNNSNYKTHQLIIEFINLEQKPTYEDVKNVVEYFIYKLYETWKINPINGLKYIIFAKNILEIVKEENERIATLSNNLSTIYKDLGDLSSALEFAKKSLEIREKVLDKNHSSLATSYNNLSMIYKDLGDLSSALKFAKKANEISEKVLDKNHPFLATSYNNLSMIYQDLGDLSSALKFAKKAFEIREKVLDKNHPDLATSYNNLSTIYQDLGDLSSALEFAKKSVEIKEKVLDKNHPDLATSYNNLSTIYKALGDLKSALKFAKKALEIREKVLNKNHPDLATSYNNLSLIYQNLGDLSSALEFAKKAHDIREKVLDKNHPNLATSYNNLSLIYQDLGEYEKAKEYIDKAIKILETIFPSGHPNLDKARKNLRILEKEMSEKSKIKN